MIEYKLKSGSICGSAADFEYTSVEKILLQGFESRTARGEANPLAVDECDSCLKLIFDVWVCRGDISS